MNNYLVKNKNIILSYEQLSSDEQFQVAICSQDSYLMADTACLLVK